VSTDVSGAVRSVVPQLAALAVQVREDIDGPVGSLGVAVPGLYIPETGVVTFLTNVPGDWSATLVGVPLAEASGLPTKLINDARAFGLAELRFGAGRDVDSFIGLTLGTGIGGVFALDNQIVQGYRGQAGEFGHQTIDPDGAWCGCGNRGCLEAYTRADQVAIVCGTNSPRQAVERALEGDERAIAGLAEIGRYLGIGIANAVTVLTPERVILGGGRASAGDLIIEPIKAEMRRRVTTTPVERIDVVQAELGTWAGAIGAAVHGAEATPSVDADASAGAMPSADARAGFVPGADATAGAVPGADANAGARPDRQPEALS
jgi:glucokinase